MGTLTIAFLTSLAFPSSFYAMKFADWRLLNLWNSKSTACIWLSTSDDYESDSLNSFLCTFETYLKEVVRIFVHQMAKDKCVSIRDKNPQCSIWPSLNQKPRLPFHPFILLGVGISMSAVDLWWSILSAFLALNFNADTQIHFPFLSSISNEGSTHHDK